MKLTFVSSTETKVALNVYQNKRIMYHEIWPMQVGTFSGALCQEPMN